MAFRQAVNHLCTAEVVILKRIFHHDLMPPLPQRGDSIAIEGRFNDHLPALHYAPARGINCRLWVLPVQHNAQRHLHVPLRLHRAAHHAERHQRLAAAVHRKARNDGVERSLAARQRVRVLWIQHKPAAPVLQADPRIRHHNA